MISGKLRFEMSNATKAFESALKGIDKKIIELGEKPPESFYKPRMKEVVEDVKCPYRNCRKVNRKFKYGEPCKYCHEIIENPWKENTICPKCLSSISTSEIMKDRDAYKLNIKKNSIVCPRCGNEFKWKKHIEYPQVHGLKYCVYCDMPYIPDKRNWKTQRLCQNCKNKRINLFTLENPTYQKNYRKQKMKKK
jgi:hypothetical protein